MVNKEGLIVIHPRCGIFLRRNRLRASLLAIFLALALGTALASLALAQSARARSIGHQTIAFVALFLLACIVSAVMLWLLSHRTGYWASRGQAGPLSLGGKFVRPTAPVVRFERQTVVNPLGIGSFRQVRMLKGVNAAGQTVVALTEMLNDSAEIEAFITTSALPVEGSWANRVGAFNNLRRRNMAPEVRRLMVRAFLMVAPFYVGIIVGLLAIILLVH